MVYHINVISVLTSHLNNSHFATAPKSFRKEERLAEVMVDRSKCIEISFPKEETGQPQKNKNNRKIRLLCYSVASALHILAAMARLFGLKSDKLEVLEKFALRTSKTVHSIVYSLLAKDAFKKGRALDTVAKILDPLISNFCSVDNINLSKGFSGGLQILDFSQTKFNDHCPDFMKNLVNSFKLTKNMAKEIYNNDFFTKERKIFVDPKKEEGHSLAFSGHGVLASSILGLIFKPLNKSMNLIRNGFTMLSNTIAMQHPDSQKNISGLLFNSYSLMDTAQKFLPKPESDFLNQVNMAIYNITIFLYGDLSNKRSEGEFTNY